MDENIQKNILKTGTSLVGIVCKGGIVMAADKKSTAGSGIILHKNSQKVWQLNDYIAISWTGSVSDIQLLKKLIAAELRLKELRDKKRPTIKQAANLVATIAYRNIRQPTMIPFIAGTLISGFDEDGTTELYTIEPAGSVIKVDDFDANFSSGMPYILGLLERQYKPGLSTSEGVELAIEAIKASSERDTGSGYGVDVFVIKKDSIKQTVKQTAQAVYTEQTKE